MLPWHAKTSLVQILRERDSLKSWKCTGYLDSWSYREYGLHPCPLGAMPPSLKWQCIGNEGYSTIAFQCVVDHTRRVLHVSDAFFGGTNDKTITANDSFPVRVAAGQYKD